jgi:hypothetical protein
MQDKALFYGWKVRRFTPVPVASVPVYYPVEQAWFLLDRFGARDRLTEGDANELRVLAGILPNTKGAGYAY